MSESWGEDGEVLGWEREEREDWEGEVGEVGEDGEVWEVGDFWGVGGVVGFVEGECERKWRIVLFLYECGLELGGVGVKGVVGVLGGVRWVWFW